MVITNEKDSQADSSRYGCGDNRLRLCGLRSISSKFFMYSAGSLKLKIRKISPSLPTSFVVAPPPMAIIVCAFAGCGAKIDKLIVGKWSDSQNNATIEFKEDGTFQYESSNLNILGISVGTSVSGTYKVDTEADPATVTIVPEIAIAGFKAGTEITFTASYNKDNKVLTLNNDSWGTLNLTEVEA